MEVPASTILVLLVSAGISLANAALYKRFVDIRRLREVRRMADELRKQVWAARKSGDYKEFQKLQRKQAMVLKETSKVMGQQAKVMLLTFAPFLAIFFGLSHLLGGAPVAYSPFDLPFVGRGVPFWLWYLLTALTFGTAVNKAIGLR